MTAMSESRLFDLDPGDLPAAGMSVRDAIAARRTHKEFTARAIGRAALEALLDAAVLAPNHRMTEPWRFVVLGPAAKQALGAIRARVKCGPIAAGDDDALAARRATIARRTAAIPAIVAVVMKQHAEPAIREEDYAATFMGVQNMLLTAAALGLGTKVSTGAVLEDRELRALLRLGPDERCVALVHVGEPAEERPAKPRAPAAERTTWLD
jgi:nitroreductase